MRFSAQLTMIMAAIFAVAAFSVAFTGFASLGEITDPVKLADARGYAWFWVFLGVVAVVFGLVSWWMVRTGKEE